MLGHTKKRPTDKVILRFEGPKRKKEKLLAH
jgi:hypothetical protein